MSQQEQKPTAPIETQPTAPETAKTAALQDQTPAERERFAQMARKEKSLRAEGKRLEALKAEIAAAQAPKQAAPLTPAEIKAQVLADPSSYGLTQDDLMQLTIGQADPTARTIRQLEAKIAALEASQSDSLKKVTATQDQAYQTALKQVRRDVDQLVGTGDEFETIKTTQSEAAVVELIERVFKDEGVLMSASEAAKEVEEYLFDEALKLASLSKVKAKLAPAPAGEEPAPKQQHSPKQPLTTLPRRIEQSSAPMSAKDRRDRAIAAFMGQKLS